MRILIADDEAPARARLASLLEELGPPWQLAAQASNGEQAIAACQADDIELVLMDVRMPGTHGIAAAQRLAAMDRPPAVIFTTAYDQHALAAFDANAVDYLLKPIRKERLLRALQKAQALSRAQLQALADLDNGEALTATHRGALQRIPLNQVIYLQADSKYVRVRHEGGEALVEDSLVSIEERFPGRFLRVHRAVLVAPTRIAGLVKAGVGTELTLLGLEDRLPVSRRHLPALRARLRSGG
jgi:two-component system response regulator AlgR